MTPLVRGGGWCRLPWKGGRTGATCILIKKERKLTRVKRDVVSQERVFQPGSKVCYWTEASILSNISRTKVGGGEEECGGKGSGKEYRQVNGNTLLANTGEADKVKQLA